MKISLLISAALTLGAAVSTRAASITDAGVTFNFFDGVHASTLQNWQSDPVFGTGWVAVPGGNVNYPYPTVTTFYGEYYYPFTFWSNYSEALVSFHVTENIDGTTYDHYFTFDGVTQAGLSNSWTDFYIHTANQPFPEDDSLQIVSAQLYGQPINVPDTGGTLALFSCGLAGLAGVRSFRARRVSKLKAALPS